MQRIVQFIILSLFALSCQSDKEPIEETNICYRCIYENNLPSSCSSELEYEICVLGFRQNSTQMVIEIKENCNGNITTTEEIRFLEDILAEQQNNGADCEEF